MCSEQSYLNWVSGEPNSHRAASDGWDEDYMHVYGDRTDVKFGQWNDFSREAMVGQVGMVTFYSQDQGRGKLKFPAPIVGNDEWEFIHSEALSNGDKVQVIDISGNSLLVKAM